MSQPPVCPPCSEENARSVPLPASDPTIGRIVIYRLTAEEAAANSTPIHTLAIGEEYPMVVLRVFPGSHVQGNVCVFGDVFGVEAATMSDAPGGWQWPKRV